jgi:lipopolysaccharide/colanic/teichoic acid biosynthesis glycosyltransferase
MSKVMGAFDLESTMTLAAEEGEAALHINTALPGRHGTLDAIERLSRHEAFKWAEPAGGYLRVKLVVEWLTALVLLVLTSPLMLALALLVKLTSPGPAFYSQTRMGLRGRHFQIFKIRTMRHNAELLTGPVWAAKADARVTPLGRLLRDTHLDELPQLINVLLGQMSLVGPRPERPEIARRIEHRVPEYRQRMAVRPGVTGLAQMLHPADDPEDPEMIGVRKKLAHDLVYVRQLSPMLDLRIWISTPCAFAVAAIDGVRKNLLRSYSVAVEKHLSERAS